MADNHHKTHAAGTGRPGIAGKAMGLASAGVAALTLPIYLTTLMIASYLFHKLATADAGVTGLLSPIAVFAAVLLTLIAASIGASSCILGVVHGSALTEAARYGSLATNMVTLPLTFLAAGFSIQCIRSKFAKGRSTNARLLTAMFALDIILMLFSLVYIIQLLSTRHERTGVATGTYNNAADVEHGQSQHNAAPHHTVGKVGTNTGGYTNAGHQEHSAHVGQHARALK